MPCPATYEFGSPGWLDALCALIEKWLADSDVDLRGVSYTSGEEFTNVPARLNPKDLLTVGWTLRIRDGVVSTAPVPPPADADSIIIGDWDAVERLAQQVGSSDPAAVEARQQEAAELEASGRLRRVQRRERPQAVVDAFGPGFLEAVHAFTAPRQG